MPTKPYNVLLVKKVIVSLTKKVIRVSTIPLVNMLIIVEEIIISSTHSSAPYYTLVIRFKRLALFDTTT